MKAQNRWAARLLRAAIAVAIFGVALFSPRNADAFCGFYVSSAGGSLTNDATQVVLMREGTRTVLSMQNQYKGPPQDFAMVVPVPVVLQKENVKTLPRDVFDRVDQLGSPRLVEYWEQDPCAPLMDEDKGEGAINKLGALGNVRTTDSATGVKIEAKFDVGEYEIVILSAQDSGALDAWLRENHYKIPANAEPLLRPYVAAGSKFFVAKVNIAKVSFIDDTTNITPGAKRAELSPLRFYFDSEAFSLPVRLGLLNSGGAQDLVVNILAPGNQRYVVANMPNVTIPTNLDVTDATRAAFPAFYAALFDKTMEKNPHAVVTEYSWSANSCDPCPTSVQGLTKNDLATLGADALPSAKFGAPGSNASSLKTEPITVTGKLPPEIVKRIVQRNSGRFRACYDNARSANPQLTGGTLNVKFVIDANGNINTPEETGARFPDPKVAQCILRVFGNFSFPKPESGSVNVIYPLTFTSPAVSPDGGVADSLQSISSDFVLTRLHARYGKDALGSDLVFQKAAPIIGGREAYASPNPSIGASPTIEVGARLSDYNTFQARYVIRHPYQGAITCKDPVRGTWGGPPAGSAAPTTMSATKIGLIKRGNADYASFVTSGPVLFAAMPTSSAMPDAPPMISDESSNATPAPEKKSGCSISANAGDTDRGALVIGVGVLAVAIARRSSRRASRQARSARPARP